MSRRLMGGLEIHRDIDSTNSYLAGKGGQGCASGYACLAEQQQAGRGRRGREWVSPFAANVYLSVLWRFTMNPALLGGLGLAVGVAVAGIGLNTRMQAQAAAGIDQPWANVEEALDAPVSRNELAGRLLEQVFIALQQFEQAGLQAFLEEWRPLDII